MTTPLIKHGWYASPDSIYWLEGYFGSSESEMKEWCATYCSGMAMVVRMKLYNDKQLPHMLHVKLTAEEDIILFRMTWV